MAAPKTVKTYDLDGSQKDFEIPFEYLARKFVTVTLLGQDRKELVLNVDYRFTQRTVITTTQVWGAGSGYERIEIKRVTAANERLVDFSDGSILRASDLNTATVQALHIAEEGRDIATDTIGVDNNGNLDARGRRLVNLADGVDPGDAITMRQQSAWADSALNSAQNSQRSAVESAASAASAKETAKYALLARERIQRFLPPSSNFPVTREDGDPLVIGDRYESLTTPGVEYIWWGTVRGWVASNLDASLLAGQDGASLVGAKSPTGAVSTVQGELTKTSTALAAVQAAALQIPRSFESFGLVGDFVEGGSYTDNTIKAREMFASGVSNLIATAGKKYFMGTVALNASTDTGHYSITHGVATMVNLNGSELVIDMADAMSAGGGVLFHTRDTPVSFQNGSCRSLKAGQFLPNDNRGIAFVQHTSRDRATSGYTISNFTVSNMQSLMTVSLASGNASPDFYRISGIHFGGVVQANECYYGLNCQHNGDQVTGQYSINKHRRCYFVYGVDQHRLTVFAKTQQASTGEVVITAYDGTRKTTTNIHLTLFSDTGASPINIGFTTSLAGNTAAMVMRNITVVAYLTNNYADRAVRLMHQQSGPGTAISPSLATFDEINITINPGWNAQKRGPAIAVESTFTGYPRVYVNAGLDIPTMATRGVVFFVGDTLYFSNHSAQDAIAVPFRVLQGRLTGPGNIFLLSTLTASVVKLSAAEDVRMVDTDYLMAAITGSNSFMLYGNQMTRVFTQNSAPADAPQWTLSNDGNGIRYTLSGHNTSSGIKSMGIAIKVLSKQ